MGMIRCPKCGVLTSDLYTKCPNCGYEFNNDVNKQKENEEHVPTVEESEYIQKEVARQLKEAKAKEEKKVLLLAVSFLD